MLKSPVVILRNRAAASSLPDCHSEQREESYVLFTQKEPKMRGVAILPAPLQTLKTAIEQDSSDTLRCHSERSEESFNVY